MICTLPQYPAFLSAHGASLATADRDRYEKQRTIVCEIVAAFEEPGADVDPAAKLAPEEEQKRVQRTERVVDLVAKVSRGNSAFPDPRRRLISEGGAARESQSSVDLPELTPGPRTHTDERMRCTSDRNHGRDASRCVSPFGAPVSPSDPAQKLTPYLRLAGMELGPDGAPKVPECCIS
jgi:hypothetical protein